MAPRTLEPRPKLWKVLVMAPFLMAITEAFRPLPALPTRGPKYESRGRTVVMSWLDTKARIEVPANAEEA